MGRTFRSPHGLVVEGDCVEGMRQLTKERPASFHCIYADPDYNVGIRYNGKATRLSLSNYIDWCSTWAKLAHSLLREDGNLFIMNYPRNNAYLWAQTLGNPANPLFYDVTEYVWAYNTNIGHSPRRFTTAHRTILHCRKSAANQWFKDQVAEAYKNPDDRRIRKHIARGSKGRMPYSWFNFNLVKNVSREKTDHSCQIPEELSELLFKACLREGDELLVLFGGSGSEVMTAMKLGVNFVTFEREAAYFDIIKDRVLKEDLRLARPRATSRRRISPTQALKRGPKEIEAYS